MGFITVLGHKKKPLWLSNSQNINQTMPVLLPAACSGPSWKYVCWFFLLWKPSVPLGSRCHTIGSMEGAVRRQKEPVIGTRMPTGVVVIKLKQSSNTEAQGSTFKKHSNLLSSVYRRKHTSSPLLLNNGTFTLTVQLPFSCAAPCLYIRHAVSRDLQEVILSITSATFYIYYQC